MSGMGQVLGDQQCTFGGAHLGVVRNQNILDPIFQHWVQTDSPDGGHHPILRVAVAACHRKAGKARSPG